MGSLWAGIAGFDLGFQRAGFKIVWQVEKDPYCRKVLAKHFPNAYRYGDIHHCGPAQLDRVNVICGGFPCQDISNAGKRSGIDGDRSGLWREQFRIVRALRPDYAVVENVAALLGRGMGRVLGDLASIGYDAEWEVISAADVGAPHLRERVWIVAYPNSDALRIEPGRIGGSSRADSSQPGIDCQERIVADAGVDGPHAWSDGMGRQARTNAAGSGPGASLADATSQGLSLGRSEACGEIRDETRRPQPERRDSDVANAEEQRIGSGLCAPESNDDGRRRGSGHSGGAIPDALRSGRRPRGTRQSIRQGEQLGPTETADAGSTRLPQPEREAIFGPGWQAQWGRFREEQRATPECGWWATEPDVGRVAHGVPARVDRLKGLGNALVPQIAEMIARRILEMSA